MGRKCRECARKLGCYEIKADWDNHCYHTFYVGIVKMTIQKLAQKMKKKGSKVYHCENNLFIKGYGERNRPPTQQYNGTATLLLISYSFERTWTCVSTFKIYLGFGK